MYGLGWVVVEIKGRVTFEDVGMVVYEGGLELDAVATWSDDGTPSYDKIGSHQPGHSEQGAQQG